MMPVLFIGHGSPMNAIQDNAFTHMLENLGKEIVQTDAIVCISAHWLTKGSWITHMQSPKTIHDFYGFPQALFDVRYPCPGNPAIAENIRKTIRTHDIQMDDEMWGIDHGTWSVVRHMYPEAKIPVLQMSINATKNFEFHYELGQQLRQLRDQNILVIGSGNVVHNLGKISWEQNAVPYDWAIEFDDWVKLNLLEGNFDALVNKTERQPSRRLSLPTTEHYIPLLYAVGASMPKDKISFSYEGIENASISMRCVRFG